MVRRSSVVRSVGVGFALWLAASPVQAQLEEVSEKRFEFTPYAGYQWGGAFETDALSTVAPAGELRLNDSFVYGGVLSFLYGMRGAVELTYLRQDTDISFDPVLGTATQLGSFAVNYIQIGGRQGFGTATRFSWSFGGGAIYMFPSQKIGLRTDLKMWVTPVPSGEYGTWCDFYGCFVAEGTAWVTQGQVTGGLVFAF